ncbi:acyltransferase [Gemmobacter sp. 24YEA27]|uniref:acyltransferase family protein n=1 Tax=Gemmobacter sp. 24YEA27 TaxID=3040672 RepID=UPI0024B38B28|nr:acyltransferase [Gemmobacter sp. 24YEA27]
MPPQHHLHGLDLLRFFAAVLVLLNHFAVYRASVPEVTLVPDARAWPWLAPMIGTGAVGVEIFFVISGFVIAMSAEGRSGARGAARFVMARGWRILPALWISGAISVAALWLTGADLLPLLPRFLHSALLLPVGPYIDGVVWSLVVEAVFYTWIALVILCGRTGRLLRVALVIGGLSAVHLALLLWATLGGMEVLQALLGRFPFKLLLLQHGVFFALGMMIHGSRRARPDIGMLCAMGVFAALGLVDIALQAGAGVGARVASVLIWLLSLAVLIRSLHWDAPRRMQPVLRFLGDLSYPLYLNHYTTGMAVTFLLHRAGLSGGVALCAALVAVGLIGVLVLRAERAARARSR